jgi:hypothetical protein
LLAKVDIISFQLENFNPQGANMSNVIDMFVTDEITGLKVANRPYRPEYIVLDENGRGLSIHKSRNDALVAAKGKRIAVL